MREGMTMNRKTKIILVMALFIITFSFFTTIKYFRIFYYNSSEFDYSSSDIDTLDYAITTDNIITDIPIESQESTIWVTRTPIQYIEHDSSKSLLEDNTSAIASITISTDKKTRTFDIMPDVNKDTLKRNIGHLPSSALPGQEGLCVLMGHRDTDFSILQYANEGDVFIINFKNTNIVYIVTQLEIVSSDNALRLETVTGTNLVLVTCYPFSYSGYAPRKFIVIAKLD